jgi:hypothetical protein
MSAGEKMEVLLCIGWLATSLCVGKVVRWCHAVCIDLTREVISKTMTTPVTPSDFPNIRWHGHWIWVAEDNIEMGLGFPDE